MTDKFDPDTFAGCAMMPPDTKVGEEVYDQDSYDPDDCIIEPVKILPEGSVDPMPAFLGSLTTWPIIHPLYPKNTQLKFLGTDNEELYKKNLERMPDNWIYRDKEIIYNFNNEHLRQKKDLKDVNMDNYAFFSGPCYTTGIGVNEEDRAADIICKELGMDLVLWSAPLAGIKMQVINFMNYLKVAPKPPKIFVVEHTLAHVWNHYSRGEFLLYYNNVHAAKVSRFPEHYNSYRELIKTDFYYQECVMWSDIARTVCNLVGTKFIETSYFTDDVYVKRHNIPHVDRTKHANDYNYAFARDFRRTSNGNPYATHLGVGIYREMADLLLTLI